MLSLVKKAGELAVKHGPSLLLPEAKKASRRVADREKAISQATRINGQFAEVWFRERQYWVVRRDAKVEGAFPSCQDEAGLERAAGLVREEEWKTPDALIRRRAKARAAKLRRRKTPRDKSTQDPTPNQE